MASSSALPTRTKITQAISQGLSVGVTDLDDIKTCLLATAKLGNQELFEAYLQQLDTTASPSDNLAHFWNQGLEAAVEGDNEDIINTFFERGAKKLFFGGAGAARSGSVERLEQLMELGLNDLSEVSLIACIRGHRGMIEFILDNYNSEDYGVDVNEMFVQSCASGDLELVKYLHRRKTSPGGYGWAMQTAANSGNLDLLIWLEGLNPDKEDNASTEQVNDDMIAVIQASAPNVDKSVAQLFKIGTAIPESYTSFGGRWNEIMFEAAMFNRVNIVHYCIDKGADKFARAINAASRGGFIETVHWLIELAGEIQHDWEKYLHWAILGEHTALAKFYIDKILDTSNQDALMRLLFNNPKIILYPAVDRRSIINLLQELHFTRWNELLFAAAKSRDLVLAKLAIAKGANDYHRALDYAAVDDDNMREYLLDMMLI